MTISVGRKGYVELIAPGIGPHRKVKIVSFTGLAADGPIAGQHFPLNTSKQGLKAVIDMDWGLLATSSFRDTGSDTGNLHLSQIDTGVASPNFSGHTMWAIITDSGT